MTAGKQEHEFHNAQPLFELVVLQGTQLVGNVGATNVHLKVKVVVVVCK